jgi:hypothetical protein
MYLYLFPCKYQQYMNYTYYYMHTLFNENSLNEIREVDGQYSPSAKGLSCPQLKNM